MKKKPSQWTPGTRKSLQKTFFTENYSIPQTSTKTQKNSQPHKSLTSFISANDSTSIFFPQSNELCDHINLKKKV
jgi:hypothetical protein